MASPRGAVTGSEQPGRVCPSGWTRMRRATVDAERHAGIERDDVGLGLVQRHHLAPLQLLGQPARGRAAEAKAQPGELIEEHEAARGDDDALAVAGLLVRRAGNGLAASPARITRRAEHGAAGCAGQVYCRHGSSLLDMAGTPRACAWRASAPLSKVSPGRALADAGGQDRG